MAARPCLEPSQPPPVLPHRASGITDTYFERVPAGGEAPVPAAMYLPGSLGGSSTFHFAGEGMWKHQCVRHLQGATWGIWEGDRGTSRDQVPLALGMENCPLVGLLTNKY
jgi:hypothetical protein